jgi:hypothetical protein
MTLTLKPMTAPTLDQLEAMTPQDMFDHTARSLLQQDGRCMEDTDCAYQNSEGSRCAVGWLIPDDFISDAAQVQGALADLVDSLEREPRSDRLRVVLGKHYDVLRGLQSAHDHINGHTGHFAVVFPKHMRQAALNLGLSDAVFGPVTE